MPRLLRALLVALGGVAALALILVLAWGIDLRRHDGRVLRNVVLARRDLGGMTRPEVAAAVGRFSGDFTGAQVRVSAEGGGFSTPAAQIGLSVDPDATTDAIFDVGRTGSVPERLVDWVRSFVSERHAPVRTRVDEAAVWRTVAAQDPGERQEPVEPRLRYEDGEFEVVPGEPGEGLDPADVIDALPDAASHGLPVVVEVSRGRIEPRFSEKDAEALIERARALVDGGVRVRAGSKSATVPEATVRRWVTSEATEEGLRLALVEDRVVEDLEKALPGAGEAPVETKFTVEGGGAVRIIAGRNGTACCAPEAGAKVEQAVLAGDDGTIEVPLRPQPPKLTAEEAEALKIAEPIASFTTQHPAGQPRVTNIHRIADILRGTVIEPGDTFSVNRTVGRRTKEKGFVSAGVIEDGRFTEDVGGGISQFATTLFNAAFFGGLDFGEYQSHSIYISRYPYGREATLSYPHPDLEIENTTPYGVLIWPTYNDRSITVTLYSTKYATGEQTAQSTAPRGACTRVTTERTRTYVDGTRKVDRVFATYRPAEGVNC